MEIFIKTAYLKVQLYLIGSETYLLIIIFYSNFDKIQMVVELILLTQGLSDLT